VLEDTEFRYENGQIAKLASSLHPSVVDKHFEWAKNYNLDSFFLQRFLGELRDGRFFDIRNKVAQLMMQSAQNHGRTFTIMYDLSGVDPNDYLGLLTKDWRYLVDTLKVTSSPRYQRHDNKPVVVIWGLGFSDRTDTPSQAVQIAQYFQSQGCFVIVGCPYYWRTGNRDARPGFVDALLQFDGLSPWAVGRYGSDTDFLSNFNNQVIDDQKLVLSRQKWYAPILFPGFSWANMNPGQKLNQIPRRNGDFFNLQANTMLSRLSRTNTFLYIAMFDEVDEGTAMFKAASTKQDTPANGNFVYLSIDGQQLPSDHYLKLAGDLTSKWKK